MGRKKMKKPEDSTTISFRLTKKLSDKFDSWCASRIIVKEKLWTMIIEDLIAGELYDIPERIKPRVRVHYRDGVIKTRDYFHNTNGEKVGQSRPNPELSETHGDEK